MTTKTPATKPKKRGRKRTGKYIVPPLPQTTTVLDGLDDLLTRTYGKHVRKRAPLIYGPEEDGK